MPVSNVSNKLAESQVTAGSFNLCLSISQHAIERGVSECAHLSKGDVDDLSFFVRKVDIIRIDGLFVFESLKLIGLAHKRFCCCKGVRDRNSVNQDSVSVDLSQVIGHLQVVPRDLVVSGDIVPTT